MDIDTLHSALINQAKRIHNLEVTLFALDRATRGHLTIAETIEVQRILGRLYNVSGCLGAYKHEHLQE